MYVSTQGRREMESVRGAPRWIKFLLGIRALPHMCSAQCAHCWNVRVNACARFHVQQLSLLLQLTLLVRRDSCSLLPARGDQLKPSATVKEAQLLSEPVELRNGGIRAAPSSSSFTPPAGRKYRVQFKEFTCRQRPLRTSAIICHLKHKPVVVGWTVLALPIHMVTS